MAKMTSLLAAQISGSFGGLTFFKGRNHAIQIRARNGPARLPTNYTSLLKTCMSAAITLWRSQTEAVRAAWAAYALTVSFSGPLGNYYLTGMTMFLRSFIPLYYYNTRGLSTIALVPDSAIPISGLQDVGPIIEADYVGPGTGVALSVTNTTGIDAVALLRVSHPWDATKLKSPGIWDTALSQAVDCPDAAATLVEIDSLVEDAFYFVSIRMAQDGGSNKIDNEYIFRMQALTVAP